jgi:hypothetical protein
MKRERPKVVSVGIKTGQAHLTLRFGIPNEDLVWKIPSGQQTYPSEILRAKHLNHLT